MIEREQAEKILKTVLAASTADETQVVLNSEDLALTRFNNNWIHQHLFRETYTVEIKVINQKRVGIATVNALDEASLRKGVADAMHNASFVKPNANLVSLPEPQPIREIDGINQNSLHLTDMERADLVASMIAVAKENHVDASGSFSNELASVAVANSKGVMCYHAGNVLRLRNIMANGLQTGYAEAMAVDVKDLDFVAVAKDALWKAKLKAEQSLTLDLGSYDTIFEAPAVADLLRFPAYIAFQGQSFLDGRSFMKEAIGKQVFNQQVSIYDDAYEPRHIVMPFDIEGVPKKKVAIFENGVAKGVVYDHATAVKQGVESTGHAGGGHRPGPNPSHLLMLPGQSSLPEMIRNTKSGVYVTRFHYTHCPEPMRCVATGTTRDGTFLIRDGEIVARLKNLRFTESMIDAFAHVDALSSQQYLVKDWWFSFNMLLPAVKINQFTFTGNTTF